MKYLDRKEEYFIKELYPAIIKNNLEEAVKEQTEKFIRDKSNEFLVELSNHNNAEELISNITKMIVDKFMKTFSDFDRSGLFGCFTFEKPEMGFDVIYGIDFEEYRIIINDIDGEFY